MRFCSIKRCFCWGLARECVLCVSRWTATAWHRATLQTGFSSLTSHLLCRRQVGTCKRLLPLLKTHTQRPSKWLEVIEWLPVETFIDFHGGVNEQNQLGSDGRLTNHKRPVFWSGPIRPIHNQLFVRLWNSVRQVLWVSEWQMKCR